MSGSMWCLLIGVFAIIVIFVILYRRDRRERDFAKEVVLNHSNTNETDFIRLGTQPFRGGKNLKLRLTMLPINRTDINAMAIRYSGDISVGRKKESIAGGDHNIDLSKTSSKNIEIDDGFSLSIQVLAGKKVKCSVHYCG